MRGKALIAGLILALCAGAAWYVFRGRQGSSQPAVGKAAPVAAATKPGVGCLGTIEPEGRVVAVTAPYYESRPSLVAELKVREGESVAQGQVLAVLDSRRLLDAALHQADARIAVAQQKLAQVRAGAVQSDIDALKAERARLVVELGSAEAELARYQSLLPGGATSKASVAERETAAATLKRSIEAADFKIRSISEVRPDDVKIAEAEVAAAMADRQNVEAQWEASVVKAPFAGQVLTILARQNEEIGPRGLLELARTGRMYVVAEVFEWDIARVRVGQQASAKIAASAQPLHGSVTRIDQQVAPAAILSSNPLSFTDNRVVKVYIRLDDPKLAQTLIHGRAEVSIEALQTN
jgi:HlyD family secretion protein